MTAAGKTIIFISHKLDEVLSIADRITVLRDGRSVATVGTSDMTKRDLASLWWAATSCSGWKSQPPISAKSG